MLYSDGTATGSWENFVQVNGGYKRAEMLEKRELEARRQQRLLREFDEILEQA
jgi:hypothetical protein